MRVKARMSDTKHMTESVSTCTATKPAAAPTSSYNIHAMMCTHHMFCIFRMPSICQCILSSFPITHHMEHSIKHVTSHATCHVIGAVTAHLGCCHVMSCHVMSCHIISHHVMSCHHTPEFNHHTGPQCCCEYECHDERGEMMWLYGGAEVEEDARE